MIDIAGLREDKRPQSSKIVHAILDRLEAAEKERDALRSKIETAENDDAHQKALAASALRVAEGWERKCDELRAKIEAMEKQEPAGYGVLYVEAANGEEDWDSLWKHRVFAEDHVKDFVQAYSDLGESVGAITVVPLYALPGAQTQPAPSVPDGFSREDLEAVADGLDGYEKTVNVGNVTGEGDDHLESTTAYAARFIRTMLAAAPEAKPCP